MKILHINEHATLKGGAEAYLLDLMDLFQSRGHACLLAYAKGEPPVKHLSLRLPSLGTLNKKQLGEDTARLRQFCEKQNPDLIHLHGTWSIELIKTCLELKPCVLTGHDYRWLCPDSKFYWKKEQAVCDRLCGWGCLTQTLKHRCLTPRPNLALQHVNRVKKFRALLPQIKAVISPSRYAAERYVQSGCDQQRLHILPYFCSFAPLSQPRTLPEDPLISFIGRIADYKGYTYFLETLAALPEHIRGCIMGDIAGDKGTQIMERAKSVGCMDRLALIPWSNRDGVAALIRKSSILIFPSIWAETLGIIGLEAMAHGVPVIGSRIGGIPDWLEDGSNGYLCPPKDSTALMIQCRKLLEDETLMQRMGERGIHSIQQRFLPAQHLDQLEQIYARALT